MDTTTTATETARRALERARSGRSTRTEAETIAAFNARGFDPAEIRPRENVLTFHAWRALGRTVRKGEKAVSITVWIPCKEKDADSDPGEEPRRRLRPKTAYLFHESQTDPLEARRHD